MNKFIRRILACIFWPLATVIAAAGFVVASIIAWIVLVIDSMYLMFHKEQESEDE